MLSKLHLEQSKQTVRLLTLMLTSSLPEVYDLQLRREQLEKTYEGVRKQLSKENASEWDRANAWLSYTRQRIANTPVMSVAARGLLAGDEWAKTIFASQVATGRAWQKAAENGVLRSGPEFRALIQNEYNDVFKGGVRGGRIDDAQVVEGAKYISLQGEIPRGEDANFIDTAFAQLEDSAKDSAFWTWVSPFTRMSYGVMEAAGRNLAGSLPFGTGKKALETLIPRYKKIMAGEYGEVAKSQYVAQMAFAQNWAYVVAGLSAAGLMTGSSSP